MRLDRLSGLMDNFELSVDLNLSEKSLSTANIVVVGDRDTLVATRVVLSLGESLNRDLFAEEAILVNGHADWGGYDNPFVASLGAVVDLHVPASGELNLLVNLLLVEHSRQRCGSGSVLNRIAEILIVFVLRSQLEKGSADVGLIAGLADARISRAIVSIHNDPGHNWNNVELATIAGISLSRFCDIFSSRVGKPPMTYLRAYRLTLAKRDIAKGQRIKSVARRYGYGSGEALCRALKKELGVTPRALQRLRKLDFPEQLLSLEHGDSGRREERLMQGAA